MALKFRRGTNAQKSGSLAFGEPYVNTDLGTLQIGGANGDITLGASGTGSQGSFAGISGSSLDITGNAKIDGNLSLGGQLTIGDATSDTVNVVASLSSSLIPQTTNAFDLGSASKIWRDLYISTGSIKFVEGTTVVKSLSAETLTALEAATGSANVSVNALNSFSSSQLTQNTALATVTGSLISTSSVLHNASDSHVNRLNNIESFSGSALTRLTALEVETANLETFSGSTLTRLTALEVETSNLETFSGSALTRLATLEVETSNLEATTASLNISVANLNTTTASLSQRVAANEAVSGTFVRTNSTNTFNGNQTVSGSLTVTQDFVVLGSSSIQNISSSNLVIGASLITLNTNTPSARFAGIHIVDSGSNGGSGSFLYDAVEDEFIMVHRGNGTNITSSHFIQGPQTYDNLGNETYLTSNRLPKGSGLEHIVDSNITDTGTLITLGSNAVVSGTLLATGTTLVSGSSQVIGILSSLNSYTASNDTTNNTQTSRLDQLSTASGSAITRLTALEVETANLEAFSSSALTRLTALEVETANLEAFTSSINTTIKNRLDANTVISGSSQVSLGSASGNIALATQTTGDYVASLVAGTGVTLSNNSGENATPTIAIGQSVATTATPTFGNLTINGTITATGDITAFFTSDKRHKNNIQTISNAVLKVKQLNGVTWEWNDDVSEVTKSTPKTGLIAQEVQQVLPQVVIEREDGFLALDYSKMVGLLVEAIKEQQTQIDQLKAQIGSK